jgi:ParB family transcriptional regulator, chromosome partitioning protein
MGKIITIHAPFDKAMLQDIPLGMLHSGTYQPRREFSEESLIQLRDTIAQLGVLEPLIVRPSQQHAGQYEIIAGERRFRAATLAGLASVPCMVAGFSNEKAAQAALIENTCREDLNPMDKAHAMQRFVIEFDYTHEEIGALLGISRSNVSNILRLLRLDGRIQHWLRSGSLSEGHGKLLAGISYDKQYGFAYEAIKKGWSVNILDEAIKNEADRKNSRKPQKDESVCHTTQLAYRLTEKFGHPVKASINRDESGSFRILFCNRQHMLDIMRRLGDDDPPLDGS